MFKFNNIARQYSVLILLMTFVVGLQGCGLFGTSTNDQTYPPGVRQFSAGLEASSMTEPPPTEGPGGRLLGVGELQSALKISSVKEISALLNPQRNSVIVESVELDFYSAGKEKVFSIKALSADKSRSFEPIKNSGSNFVGYVFNLDPQKIGEAEKYFVPENSIKVVPRFDRNKPVSATFYLVSNRSELTK